MAGRARRLAVPGLLPLVAFALVLLLAGTGTGTALATPVQDGPATPSGTPADGNASVTFRDQSYLNLDHRVLVANATLPDGGFVVLVDGKGRRRGATEYLDPGEHRDLVLAIDPPACDGATLTAVAYRDDGNGRLDQGDEPYRVDGVRVDATAEVTPTAAATYDFVDQTSDGDAVTVDLARVPEGGGFVLVGTTNDSLLADSQPPVVAERLGHSAYLEGGGEDIRVPLDRSPDGTVRLVAVTYADRGEDRTFDAADAPAGPLCQHVGYGTANVTFRTPTHTLTTEVTASSTATPTPGVEPRTPHHTDRPGPSVLVALGLPFGLLLAIAVGWYRLR